MNNNIFIPKTIKIGYQNRKDTYTGKLAYIIYTDEKGKLRKERSWDSWRDQKIEPSDFNNEPISGFVLNKKVGGHSSGWNHRQTYSRIYDPRGFEFEITVENLLYILENANCLKGKGLEGEFVYGWSGTELILLPLDSPDYEEISKLNSILHEKKHILGKDLIVGATYLTRDNKKLIYLGRFSKYSNAGKSTGKYYFFFERNPHYDDFIFYKSLGNKIVLCDSEECVEDYAELMEKLEGRSEYSPIDKEKYIPYSLKDFKKKAEDLTFYQYFYTSNRESYFRFWKAYGEYSVAQYSMYGTYSSHYSRKEFTTIEEIFDYYKPTYKETYLKNGKLYETTK